VHAVDDRPAVCALAAREVVAARHLTSVLDALHAAGLAPLVIKGAALAAYYPEPWMRPRRDDDLLVRADRFERAGEVLLALGYRRQPQSPGPEVLGQAHFTRPSPAGPHHVDLHWRLLVPPAFDGLPGVDDLLARSVPLPGFGLHARAPHPVDALLHAAAHHVAHHATATDRRWWLDIDALVTRFTSREWRDAAAAARRAGVARIVGVELARTREHLGTPMPDDLVTALCAVTGEPSAAHLRAGGRLHRWWLEIRHGRHGVWAAIRARAFPASAYMTARYGVPSALVPIAYGWRLGAGGARWMYEALSRRGH
jgi:hypothetical protein